MARTANVFARVEPDIKKQAEDILLQLGIPMSNAISSFLRRIILQRGLPFNVTLSNPLPIGVNGLTKESLDKALQAGLSSIESDKGISSNQVRSDFKKRYHL